MPFEIPSPSGAQLSRRRALQLGGLTAAAIGATPLLAACGGGSDTKSTSQAVAQKVAVGLGDTFAGFSPALAVQLSSLTVIRHVFEPLVRYDQFTNEITPWIFADGPTRTQGDQLEATLLDGMTFHDGSPVEANDVAFSIEYMQDPENGSPFGAFVDKVTSVKTQGSRVTFQLEQDYAAFVPLLSLVYLMPRKVLETVGKDEFANKPVGSGPYKLVSSTPNQVSLARHKEYKGKFSVHLDEIDFAYVPDDSTRAVQLRSKRLDIITKVPFRDYEALEQTKDIETAAPPSDAHLVLDTNHNNGPMSDVRVRQALLFGMDRDEIVKRVYMEKYGTVADSLLPESHPFFVRPKSVYRYDPARAKSLLAEAGHPDGVDFELLLSNIPYIQEVGQQLQSQWEEVGLRAKIRLTETEAGYGIVATKKYDAFLAYGVEYALGQDADLIYRMFTYGANRTGFYGSNSPEEQQFDKHVDAGLLGKTDDDRITHYAAAQEILSEHVMNNFPLIFMSNLGAWRTGVTGYEPGPGHLPDLTTTRVTASA